MDLDAGEEARDVRAEAREPAQPPQPQAVIHAMQEDRVQARIAGEHLPDVAGGGIAVEDAADVLADAAEHGLLGQSLGGERSCGRSLAFPSKLINYSTRATNLR